MKVCAVCDQHAELAYRCKWERNQGEWRFVCRPCWPQISGVGYLEKRQSSDPGDDDPSNAAGASTHEGANARGGNPSYRYGGTWKSTTGLTKAEVEELSGKQHAATALVAKDDSAGGLHVAHLLQDELAGG